jgi:hypothetical protein
MPGKNLSKPITAPSGSSSSAAKAVTGKAKEGADWNSKNSTGEYESNPSPKGAVGGKNTFGAG